MLQDVTSTLVATHVNTSRVVSSIETSASFNIFQHLLATGPKPLVLASASSPAHQKLPHCQAGQVERETPGDRSHVIETSNQFIVAQICTMLMYVDVLFLSCHGIAMCSKEKKSL